MCRVCLLLFAEPPLQIFVSFLFPLFFFGLEFRLQLFPQFHELLMCNGKTATFAHIALSNRGVLHFATTFRTVRHAELAFSSQSMLDKMRHEKYLLFFLEGNRHFVGIHISNKNCILNSAVAWMASRYEVDQPGFPCQFNCAFNLVCR